MSRSRRPRRRRAAIRARATRVRSGLHRLSIPAQAGRRADPARRPAACPTSTRPAGVGSRTSPRIVAASSRSRRTPSSSTPAGRLRRHASRGRVSSLRQPWTALRERLSADPHDHRSSTPTSRARSRRCGTRSTRSSRRRRPPPGPNCSTSRRPSACCGGCSTTRATPPTSVTLDRGSLRRLRRRRQQSGMSPRTSATAGHLRARPDRQAATAPDLRAHAPTALRAAGERHPLHDAGGRKRKARRAGRSSRSAAIITTASPA